ncbi:MAG: PH domain-containing protein [Bacilli bacterium]|nr:PH domain-containing protein [Bacilli bacterium]
MAFIKYKELTQYFNFFNEVDYENIPSFIHDYINSDEKIFAIYKTYRDHGVFTNKKIILFDQRGTGNVKEITIIPHKSISSLSIKFRKTSAEIYMNLNSGYPLRLKFIKLTPEDKMKLRILYTNVNKEVVDIN